MSPQGVGGKFSKGFRVATKFRKDRPSNSTEEQCREAVTGSS
jgi:hypothetical protein